VKSFYRMLRTALRALRRHKIRSALTCLGIVIGVASVVAMMEIGQGSSYVVQQAIASIGANVVNVDPSDAVKAGVSSGSGGRITLVPADCDAIRRECSAVVCAAPALDIKAQVIHGNRNYFPNEIKGTTPDYFLVRNWTNMDQGEMFTDSDVQNSAPVCVIGQTVLRELFQGDSPVGKEIRVKDVSMKVLGVLSAKGVNMMGRDQDDYVFAPWTTVKYRLIGSRQATVPNVLPSAAAGTVNTLKQIYPNQQLQFYPQKSDVQAADVIMMARFTDLDDIYMSVNSPQEVPQVIRQIKDLLRRRHRLAEGTPDDFRIRDLTETSEAMASTGRLMTSLLLWVAMIALVVGGVGIMNIMLTSVKERTREIGVRMAVGARPKDVLRQFLIEAVVLCLFGGIGGILVGHGAAYIVSSTLGWPTMTSPVAMAVAFGVSALVGVVFGYYPAWTASRLDPIEALRYE
jgi:ABC-type antimicrobial peptide transport system permease subunit